MSSFLNRLKKKEEPIIEDEPQIEDRIHWVSILQKITFPVLNNLLRHTTISKYQSQALQNNIPGKVRIP